MPVTIQRPHFTPEDRALIVEAVLTGCAADADVESIAMEIAEKLPDLLRKAQWPDNSENRKRIVELVLLRWSMPKTRRSLAYRRLARR